MENKNTFVKVIELTNLDYAVATYIYNKNESPDYFSSLKNDDLNSNMTEIRSLIFGYGEEFINSKIEKNMISTVHIENVISYEDPFDVIDDGKGYLYSDDGVDNFLASKIISWISDPDDLRDTLEQATLKESANFYIADLVEFYNKNGISVSEMPDEIKDKYSNGDYEKYRSEENEYIYASIDKSIMLEKMKVDNVDSILAKKIRL